MTLIHVLNSIKLWPLKFHWGGAQTGNLGTFFQKSANSIVFVEKNGSRINIKHKVNTISLMDKNPETDYIGSSGSKYRHVRLTKTRCIQCFFTNTKCKKNLLLGDLVGALQLFKGVWNFVAGRSHHKEVMYMTRNHSIILYKLAKRWINLHFWLFWGPWGYFYYIKGSNILWQVCHITNNLKQVIRLIQDKNKIHTHVFHK